MLHCPLKLLRPKQPKTRTVWRELGGRRQYWRTARLESLSGAAPAAMDALDDDVNEEDETDVLKLAHAIAGIDRDTIRYKQELDTLTENFKLETEALEHVQDRVTSVASELNAVMSGEQTETLTEARELGTRSAWSKNSRMWPLWPRLRRTHPRPKGKCCSAAGRMVPSCPAA